MSTQQPKKKLCWNCEGRVTLHEENCPFCGVYLSPLGKIGEPENKGNLFAPPYQVEDSDSEEQKIPAAPFAMDVAALKEKVAALPADAQLKTGYLTEEMKTVILPLILLSAGTVLLLFGIALLLFSQNGVFTLKWDAEHWYIYLLLALPMLFFGWWYIQKGRNET